MSKNGHVWPTQWLSELKKKFDPSLARHSGLQTNLNLCIFLHAFNAISEWEYVKKESMCIFFLISMICLLENVSFIHFKCNMGHIQFMFHIYYTEFVPYKSWNNILIVLCVMPPWLSGKALDKTSHFFCFLEGPWFESWLIPTFLAIFGHFISTHQHHFAYRKLLLFLQKGNSS